MTASKQKLTPHKAALRSLVDLTLRLQGTKLPAYFHLRDRISYLFHGLEPSVIRVARTILRPGDTAVDIGANVGFLTREFAALVGRRGHVFAFEPDPATFDCLAFNVQKLPQVRLSKTAIADRAGTMTLHLHPTSGMSNSLVNAWDNASALEVETSTLDDWISRTVSGPVRMVKIDVEGAEAHVLRGMENTLEGATPPQVIMEFCPKNLGGTQAEEEIFQLMGRHGYRLAVIGPAGGLHRVSTPSEIRVHLNENDYANLLGWRDRD